jgi:hypothetical protein
LGSILRNKVTEATAQVHGIEPGGVPELISATGLEVRL